MGLICQNLAQDNMPTVNRKRKKHLRSLERNKSGRNATVKMATYSGDKKYYAAPTITFKGNEKARPQTFEQALEAGEVYEFRLKKKADRFFSNTINIHLVHPLFISIYYIYYSVKSLFYKCFYSILAMQVLYIFYLTISSKYERMYKC